VEGRFPLDSTENVPAVFPEKIPKKFDGVSARVHHILCDQVLPIRLYEIYRGSWIKYLCPEHSRQVASLMMLLIAGRGSVLAFGDVPHSRAG
jgi:hypothetical protein